MFFSLFFAPDWFLGGLLHPELRLPVTHYLNIISLQNRCSKWYITSTFFVYRTEATSESLGRFRKDPSDMLGSQASGFVMWLLKPCMADILKCSTMLWWRGRFLWSVAIGIFIRVSHIFIGGFVCWFSKSNSIFCATLPSIPSMLLDFWWKSTVLTSFVSFERQMVWGWNEMPKLDSCN